MDTIQVNGQPYTVTRLLGKGKGGYSYLAQGSEGPVVVKQIHHEPCSYYQFGDKLQSELRDYRTLSALGIPMPRLLAVDEAQERLVKQYIPGPTGWNNCKRARCRRKPKSRCGRCAAFCTLPG